MGNVLGCEGADRVEAQAAGAAVERDGGQAGSLEDKDTPHFPRGSLKPLESSTRAICRVSF